MKFRLIIIPIIIFALFIMSCQSTTSTYIKPFVEAKNFSIGYSNFLMLLNSNLHKDIYRITQYNIMPSPTKDLNLLNRFSKIQYEKLLKAVTEYMDSDVKKSIDYLYIAEKLKQAASQIPSFNESVVVLNLKLFDKKENEFFNQIFELYCTVANSEPLLIMTNRIHLNNLSKVYNTRKVLGTAQIQDFYEGLRNGIFKIGINDKDASRFMGL